MLTGLFCVLSAAATALTYGLQPEISLWWIPGLLLGYYLAVCVAYILFLLLFTLCLPRQNGYSTVCRWLLVWSIRWALPFLRCRLRVSGLEKLPDGPFLLVGNHVSNLDPMLALAAMPRRRLAFVSKPENFRYPIAGGLIRRSGFLAIDRENPRNALLTIEKAAKLIESDEVSIGIYPEGTRSKECVLLPFHNGVFKIAQKASVPIVVASIQGTEQIHRNWYRRRSDVQFRIIETIPTEFVIANRTSVIGERVHNELSAALKET